MPLPVNSTLSLLGASRPGDAIPSKPKKAMLVRLSSATLDVLEASIAQPQLRLEFGDSPGMFIGESFFPMAYLSDSSINEVYLRAASAMKRNAPLKLYADVVGKLTIEQREIGNDLRDRIRGSTQDAVAQKNSRSTVFVDNPPELQTVHKKRKEVSMFHKPLRPSDKARTIPLASTPPSKPSPSPQSHGVPVLKRLVHCLARGEKQEDELFKLLGASDRSSSFHASVLALLDQFADLKPSPDKCQRVYQLKPIAWKEVRPYEWPGLSVQERSQMARMGQMNLKTLQTPASDPLWTHFQIQPFGVASVPTSSTSSDPRSISSATVDHKASAAPKRGVLSREIKEKKKLKIDAKAGIQAKEESRRTASSYPSTDESRRPSAGEASTSAAGRRLPPSSSRPTKPVIRQDMVKGFPSQTTSSSSRPTKPAIRQDMVKGSPSQTTSSRASTTSYVEKASSQDVKRIREVDMPTSSSKGRAKTKERQQPQEDRKDDKSVEKPKPKKKLVEDEIDRVIRKAVGDEDYVDSKEPKRKAREDADYLESRKFKRRAVESDSHVDSRAKLSKHNANDNDNYVNPNTSIAVKRRPMDSNDEHKASASSKQKADPDGNHTGATSNSAKRKAAEPDDDYEPARQKRHKTGRDATSLIQDAKHLDEANPLSAPQKKNRSPPPPSKRDALNGKETEQLRSSTVSSSKPRRRKSPVYTSTEDEKEDTPSSKANAKRQSTPPLAAVSPVKTQQPTRNINAAQPLPSDNTSLRARYGTKYLEYLNIMQQLLVQKGRLDTLLRSNELESSGSITDSEGDVELLSPEELEIILGHHNRLQTELQAIKQQFDRKVAAKGLRLSD